MSNAEYMTSFAHLDGHGLLLTSEDTCAYYNTRLPRALRSVNNDKPRCLSMWNYYIQETHHDRSTAWQRFTRAMRVCHKDMSSSPYRGILNHRPRHSANRSFESTASIPQPHSLNGYLSGPLLHILPSASRLCVVSLSTRYPDLRCVSLDETF